MSTQTDSLPSPSSAAIPPPSSPPTTLTGSQTIPTPTHGPGGSFTSTYSAVIAAPPALCLATVLDNASYPRWNRFCRRVEVYHVPEFPANVTPALERAIELIPRSSGARSPARRASPDSNDNGNKDNKGNERAVETEREARARERRAKSHHAARKASVISLSPPRRGLSAGVRTQFRFEVHMDINSESFRMQPLEITYLEEIKRDGRRGFMVAWKIVSSTAMPGWMFRSERIQEFLEEPPPTEDGAGDEEATRNAGTLYRCWETFYGVLGPVMRLVVAGQLEKGFQAWGDDLKEEAERRYEEMGREMRD